MMTRVLMEGAVGVQRIAWRLRWGPYRRLLPRLLDEHGQAMAPGVVVVVSSELVLDAWGLLRIVHRIGGHWRHRSCWMSTAVQSRSSSEDTSVSNVWSSSWSTTNGFVCAAPALPFVGTLLTKHIRWHESSLSQMIRAYRLRGTAKCRNAFRFEREGVLIKYQLLIGRIITHGHVCLHGKRSNHDKRLPGPTTTAGTILIIGLK